MSTAVAMAPPDRGAVLIGVVSPSRIVLVRDPAFEKAYWKLPGGSIEFEDNGVHGAAIRELAEETGLTLTRGQLRFFRGESEDDVRYYPHVLAASIAEEEMDLHHPEGWEDGHRIEVKAFDRIKVGDLDLLPEHQEEIRKLAGA